MVSADFSWENSLLCFQKKNKKQVKKEKSNLSYTYLNKL